MDSIFSFENMYYYFNNLSKKGSYTNIFKELCYNHITCISYFIIIIKFELKLTHNILIININVYYTLYIHSKFQKAVIKYRFRSEDA